jgi:acyl-CoA thioesterase
MLQSNLENNIQKIKDDFNDQAYCKLLGIEVINISKGTSQLILRFNKNQLNQNNIIHGGIISSLADSAAAVALLSSIEKGKNISTIELKINFIRSVKKDSLIADAKIIHKGSKISVVDIDIKNQEEHLIAKCLATFMIL